MMIMKIKKSMNKKNQGSINNKKKQVKFKINIKLINLVYDLIENSGNLFDSFL